MTRLKKNHQLLLVDPIPNSLNSHHKTCMADSKENYCTEIFGVKGLKANFPVTQPRKNKKFIHAIEFALTLREVEI